MGFWGEIKNMKNIVALEEAARKDRGAARYLVNVKEWDCFDDLVEEWRKFFVAYAKVKKVNPRDIVHGGTLFESAMSLDGSTPPAKLSGGNATVRATELCDKYGGGTRGPNFGEAMAEGLRLARGERGKYATRSKR